MNYHLYNPFYYLNNQSNLDFNAVGTQSYFNPLLDIPYYYISMKLNDHPRLVSFLAGIPTGILVVTVGELSFLVARGLPGNHRLGGWFATIMGLSGTMLYSEIGTSFGDVPIAVLIVGGLIWPARLLRHPGAEASAREWQFSALAMGALFGCAAGMKPVAAIYAPASLAAILTQAPGLWRRKWPVGFCYCAGWAIGAVLTYGWWGVRLYEMFGNPLFPLLNNLFPTDWMPPTAATDKRFLPRSLVQSLFYPFYWLQGRPFIASETGVRDAHFALAEISLLFLALLSIIRSVFPRLTPESVTTKINIHMMKFLVIFFFFGFLIWESLFSILRYAIPLEVLTGPIVYIAIAIVAALLSRRDSSHRYEVIMVTLILIATIGTANRPGWGRVRQYGSSLFEIAAPPLANGSIVVVADKPLGFVLPFIKGQDLHFIGIVDLPPPPYRLWIEAKKRLSEDRPVSVLINRSPQSYAPSLASFGLKIDPATCGPIHTYFQRGVAICSASHIAESDKLPPAL